MNFNQVKEEDFKRRSNLLETFTGTEIEKAISQEEFDQQYGQGYEVFTIDGVNSFVENATADYSQGEVPDEVVKAIEDEIGSLSKIIIKGDSGYSTKYIREIVKSETPDTEEVADVSETEEATDTDTADDTPEVSQETETPSAEE